MKNDFTTDDWVIATMLQYLGYPFLKIEGFGNQDTQWTFRVPSEDAKIVADEIKDPQTQVLLVGWVAALKNVQSFQKLSRERGGVYTSHEYAQVQQ